ncbi:MAG: hypothetical protein ACOWWO_05870 [Peptococcaceae bacterium]
MIKSKNFVMIVCVSFIMATALTFGVSQKPSIAENNSKISNKDIINKAGKVVKENLEELKKLTAALLKKTSDLTVAATIEDMVTLSEEEFIYLKKMHAAHETDKSDGYVFNVLIEEKIQFAEAEKRGLLPTEDEVTEYINKERKLAEEAPEVLKELIVSLGLTEDEYWNVYERFYATKIVLYSKLSEAFYKEAGLEIKDKPVTFELLESQKEHYKEFLQKLKNKAKVTISKEFKDFSYDKTVLTVN